MYEGVCRPLQVQHDRAVTQKSAAKLKKLDKDFVQTKRWLARYLPILVAKAAKQAERNYVNGGLYQASVNFDAAHRFGFPTWPRLSPSYSKVFAESSKQEKLKQNEAQAYMMDLFRQLPNPGMPGSFISCYEAFQDGFPTDEFYVTIRMDRDDTPACH